MRAIILLMTTKLARCMRAKRLFIAFLDDIKDLDLISEHRVDIARFRRERVLSFEDEADRVVFESAYSHAIQDRRITMIYLVCYMYFRKRADLIFKHYLSDEYGQSKLMIHNDIKSMMHDTYSFLRFKEEISKVFIHLDGCEVRR